MYSCQLRIVLSGLSDAVIGGICNVAVPDAFSIAFDKIKSLEEVLELQTSDASLLIWEIPSTLSGSEIADAISSIPANIPLTVLIDDDRFEALSPYLEQIEDIWPAEMTPAEVAFRFSRWLSRKKQEAEGWQASQFLETTINSIPNLIWYKTKDGIHEKVNDSFCEAVGKEKDDVQGRGHAYIWDVEEDDPACIASEEIVMSTGKTSISEEQVLTGEGEKLLTTYKSPLYDIDGQVMGTVGVAIDITQEREYEKSLIEKNDTLENIFTALDCGIITHSIDGSTIESINRGALEILGYPSMEALMEDGFDMVAPSVFEEDQIVLKNKISTLKNEGDTVAVDYRVRHKTGEVLYVMGSVKLVEKDGQLFYQRFMLDVTDQKLAEQQKDRRQKDLVQALSSDYVVVCAFDLDAGTGELLRITNEYEDVLSNIFTENMVIDECLRAYFEMRLEEPARNDMLSNINTKRLIEDLRNEKRLDYLLHTSLGLNNEYIQVTFVRVGDWKSHHLCVFGIKNVDKKTREELIQKSLLQDALNEANAANDAKSKFLTNMSHDIRTPMNAILGFTTLAINHIDEDERVEDYLQKIRSSGSHLLNLINDILDMSRIESGIEELNIEVNDFSRILENVRDIMNTEAHDKGIEFTLSDETHDECAVYCDKLKINQILINLVGNALKFTKRGGSVAIIADDSQKAPEGYIGYRIRVIDSGIGIDPNFIPNIFSPFERERTSTISGIQGTGLGLAITHNLVEMMNGTIEVESQPNIGSTFTVNLMLKRAEGASVVEDDESAAVIPDRLRGSRALLAEDNLFNQEIVTMLLGDAGFEIECANDGIEAIEMLKEKPNGYYRFVLMDIQMPKMNGYDATRAIRSMDEPELSSIPIVAVSADAFDSDRQKAIQAGMNGHIQKPIEVNALLKLLDSIL